MSDHTRLIDEKIKLKPQRRSYCTDSSYNYYLNDRVEEYRKVTETIPAGIAGKPASEKRDTTANITVNKLHQIKDENLEAANNAVLDYVVKEDSRKKVDWEVNNTNAKQIQSIYPSYIRLHSLIPDDQKVTVVLGDNYVYKNIKCDSTTKYITLDPGIYHIQFFDSNSNELLYDYKLKAFNCAVTTLVLTKTDGVYNVLGLRGATTDHYDNTSYIRFMQTLPFAPAMDIYIDGIPVIWGISSNETSELISMPSGVHNIKVTAAATSYTYADNSFDFSADSINDMFLSSDNNSSIKLSCLVTENVCI